MAEVVDKKSGKKEDTQLDVSKMNIFTKIQHVRVGLQEMNLTKSGRNKFSEFNYFELSDFMPAINELCLKYHLFTFEDINSNIARITAVDCDNPDITFTLTMDVAEVEMKGMNKVQGIGSQSTYFRRYLNMALFEISEVDLVDATSGKEDDKSPKKLPKTNKKDELTNNKTIMKNMCTELSKKGKKDNVTEVLERVASVKNPNSIQDEEKIINIIEELKKIEA